LTRNKVVSAKNLPARLPITQTAIWWLLMDRFHALAWVWGSTGVLVFLAWALAIFAACVQDRTDIWP
jgi:hypothetical protein